MLKKLVCKTKTTETMVCMLTGVYVIEIFLDVKG